MKLHNTVKPSVDYVCQLKFPSGNYPPCIGDTRDLLIHWCHGAPGVIYMLLQAYKVPETLQRPLNEKLSLEKMLGDHPCLEVGWLVTVKSPHRNH